MTLGSSGPPAWPPRSPVRTESEAAPRSPAAWWGVTKQAGSVAVGPRMGRHASSMHWEREEERPGLPWNTIEEQGLARHLPSGNRVTGYECPESTEVSSLASSESLFLPEAPRIYQEGREPLRLLRGPWPLGACILMWFEFNLSCLISISHTDTCLAPFQLPQTDGLPTHAQIPEALCPSWPSSRPVPFLTWAEKEYSSKSSSSPFTISAHTQPCTAAHSHSAC